MKGPFSIWGFFGLTIWIDTFTHAFFELKGKKAKHIDPYNPVRDVSVIIPVHKEGRYIEGTIVALYAEHYPLKRVIVCGDKYSAETKAVVRSLMPHYMTLSYLESPYVSKAKKINYAVQTMGDELGEFVYVRDARVVGSVDCIEKMVSCFTDDTVAAVTSYGRLSFPKNFLSRSYYYGKSWVNEIGRFRKRAQEKRDALFVICGASTMYHTDVLNYIPIPGGTKTEDTHYTWRLQTEGFRVRVADDAVVSAPELDGKGLTGIKNQLKQAHRWSSGTIQCFYKEGHNIPNNKRLFYSTVLPGFLEAVTYSIPLVTLPLLLWFFPVYGLAFLIGDTVFSLLGTLVLIPKKFVKTLIHYPQIFFFKYLNALVFVYALVRVTAEAIDGRTKKWYNEWIPQQTDYVAA
jgi:cellulose synthase/poly-beta-1,6-N-acetylglucosamine synthase-like glycosyltransferase